LGGDRGHRPSAAPDAAAAARARREAAERVAHRLALEVERLRAEDVVSHAAIARVLTERGLPTPQGTRTWTHTTVARVPTRACPDAVVLGGPDGTSADLQVVGSPTKDVRGPPV
jgi:hypothetical protein